MSVLAQVHRALHGLHGLHVLALGEAPPPNCWEARRHGLSLPSFIAPSMASTFCLMASATSQLLGSTPPRSFWMALCMARWPRLPVRPRREQRVEFANLVLGQLHAALRPWVGAMPPVGPPVGPASGAKRSLYSWTARWVGTTCVVVALNKPAACKTSKFVGKRRVASCHHRAPRSVSTFGKLLWALSFWTRPPGNTHTHTHTHTHTRAPHGEETHTQGFPRPSLCSPSTTRPCCSRCDGATCCRRRLRTTWRRSQAPPPPSGSSRTTTAAGARRAGGASTRTRGLPMRSACTGWAASRGFRRGPPLQRWSGRARTPSAAGVGTTSATRRCSA